MDKKQKWLDKFMNIHLIVGSNNTLAKQQLKIIQKKYQSLATFTPNHSLSDIIQASQTVGLFSSNDAYVISQPKWLQSSAELSDIELLLAVTTHANIDLIIETTTIDKRSKPYKIIKSHTLTEYDCPEFKAWELHKLSDWIIAYCHTINMTIHLPSIKRLINAHETNIGHIKQRIDTCALMIHPRTTIEESDIIHIIGKDSHTFMTLTAALKANHPEKIIQTIQTLLTNNVDAKTIINHILFQCNTLYPIQLAIQEKIPSDTVAKQLKKHPFYIKKLMEDVKRAKSNTSFQSLYLILANIDSMIKKGRMGKQSATHGLARICDHFLHQN